MFNISMLINYQKQQIVSLQKQKQLEASMSAIFQGRKTSMQNRFQRNSVQKQIQIRLEQVKSLKESPQQGSCFWLNRKSYNNTSRCDSHENARQKSKIKKTIFNQFKNTDQVHQLSSVSLRPLQRISSISLQSGLYILQSALKQCLHLHHKFGSSYFTIKNCYLNDKNKLIIRSDQPYTQTYIAISDQTVVVRDIIQAVHKICVYKSFDDFYFYYKRASMKNKCDFKYALSLIRSYCMCSKMQVADKVSYLQADDYDKKIHPRSAQKISMKQQINPLIKRKSYTKGYRESLTRRLTQNWEHLKNTKTQITNSENIKVQLSNIRNNKPLTAQNSIQNQFSLTLKPNNTEDNQFCQNNSKIKESSISTNFKTSLHLSERNSIIMSNRFVGSFRTDSNFKQNKQYLSSLPTDLDQVQSIGQSSDPQIQNNSPHRCYETPRDAHQLQIKRQNQERILSINNWTRTVNDLLSQDTDLKQSFNQLSHKDTNIVNKNQMKAQQNTKMLGRMARTTTQSILPIPSEFLIRQP